MPNTYGQFPDSVTDAVDVDGGRYHTIVLHADGHISAYGPNAQGQCDIPPGTYSAVGAGRYTSMAVEGIPGPAPQLGFYVDAVYGSDLSGDGTQEFPFETIPTGLEHATGAGSYVIVMPGIYTVPIVTGSPLVIMR